MAAENLAGWIQLSRVSGVGVTLFLKLIETLETPERVLEASRAELTSVPRIRSELADRIRAANNESACREAEAELKAVENEGARMVTIRDEEYPELLRSIYGPPPFLFVRGGLLATQSVAVAMVGTRQATSYGLRAAESIAAELATHGITIVSGLAQGIDSACHEGALAAGGRTSAVLGCGFGHKLPPQRRKLLERIAERGAVLTEFGMTMPPRPENFPRRNRIISGLCVGTVVVEAGERSGALITASFAAEQGREVFAVPGRINDIRSMGCNRLIQEGAHLAQCAADIRQVIASRIPGSLPARGVEPDPTEKDAAASRRIASPAACTLTEDENSIYQILTGEARHVDEVTRESGEPPHRVAQILLSLELKGIVIRESGMRYARSP